MPHDLQQQHPWQPTTVFGEITDGENSLNYIDDDQKWILFKTKRNEFKIRICQQKRIFEKIIVTNFCINNFLQKGSK